MFFRGMERNDTPVMGIVGHLHARVALFSEPVAPARARPRRPASGLGDNRGTSAERGNVVALDETPSQPGAAASQHRKMSRSAIDSNHRRAVLLAVPVFGNA